MLVAVDVVLMMALTRRPVAVPSRGASAVAGGAGQHKHVLLERALHVLLN